MKYNMCQDSDIAAVITGPSPECDCKRMVYIHMFLTAARPVMSSIPIPAETSQSINNGPTLIIPLSKSGTPEFQSYNSQPHFKFFKFSDYVLIEQL
jgi:hypothetical protein